MQLVYTQEMRVLEIIRRIIDRFGWDMGVDLGTSNLTIFLRDRGVVVEEASVLARLRRKRWMGLGAPERVQSRPVAYGYKAKEMANREPRQIEVVNPIAGGMIADLEATEELIGYFLRLVNEVPKKRLTLLKPGVLVGIVGGMTNVQRRALKSVFLRAGAGEVTFVESAVLAAIGIGLPIDRGAGLVVVDVGGGKTEVSVVSMGGVVVEKNIKTAGNELDLAIMNYVKMKYGLLIGPNTAERAKIEIFAKTDVLVRGRDLEGGLPKTVKLSDGEVEEAIGLGLSKIVKTVKEVLDETPPELVETILKRGIVMVGRGSQVKGLREMIEKEVKITTRIADEPGWSVVKGCGDLIQDKEKLKEVRLISGY